MPETQSDVSRIVDRQMTLSRELDEIVAQVRTLEGFEDFLRSPRLETLLPAALDGPVVIINISRWRCDALIVTMTGVDVVELRRLSAAGVGEKASDYLRVLSQVDETAQNLADARQRFDSGDRGLDAISGYTKAKLAVQDAERDRDQTLAAILAWLWDEVADPVLSALGFLSTPPPGEPWPRLWWCPTGLLTLLPLHAAGHYDAGGQSSGRAVLDRAVSSYAPTLRALLEARRPLASAPDDEQILVVALEETPGQPSLGDVTRERELVASLFPGRHTLLDGAAATWQAVRDELPRHRWAHFSCHGGQDLTDPSQGGLLLYDRLLTIADIGTTRYRGEFAFLSACMTATGGIKLPDEAITLAAALHYAGYRHVIGTLWSVDDQTAADVAESVYGELTTTGKFEPGRSAHALHTAIRGIRDLGGVPPSAWVPFTHTGP
jgi:CHAT domain-containing protein